MSPDLDRPLNSARPLDSPHDPQQVQLATNWMHVSRPSIAERRADHGPTDPKTLEERWFRLTHQPNRFRADQAILAEATRFADHVAMVRATATRGEPETTLPLRDTDWLRTALFWHDLLQDAAIDVPLGRAEPRCQIDSDKVRAWLHGPSPTPDGDEATAAAFWGIDDTFHADDPDIGVGLAVLIEQVQRAGVFGIAEHTIALVRVQGIVTEFDGHLLTLTAPAGSVAYASGPLTTDALIDPQDRGIDAAIGALQRAAERVDDILAAQGANWLPIARSRVVNSLDSYLYADLDQREPEQRQDPSARRPAPFPHLTTTAATAPANPGFTTDRGSASRHGAGR
jgi:hypothetical protein